MIYTSIDNVKIKEIAKLNDKKFRDQNNLFLVEGEHLVKESFKYGYLKTLIVAENCDFTLDIETMIASEKVLKYLSNLKTTPKVMGVCHKKSDKVIGSKIIMLDNIQDPGNLGTIIRSAVAFNVDTIVLSPNTVDLYNEKVIRATQGLIFTINIVVNDLLEIIKNLKQNNYLIYGTKVNGGKSLKTIEKSSKFAIIMGNEGNGVDAKILESCDKYLYINMNKNCESLNVAVATSIILYELDK